MALLSDSKADTAKTWLEVLGALDAEATVKVEMGSNLEALPKGFAFGRLAALTSISMKCARLYALPEGLFSGLAALTSINLFRCRFLLQTSAPGRSPRISAVSGKVDTLR